MSMSYRWHLLYEQGGRTYVLDRFETYDPGEARRNHEHSCAFLWVTDEMENPLVSALEAVDGRAATVIREACRPGQDPKRIYKAVPPPPGLFDDQPTTLREPEPPARPAPGGHPWDS